MKLNLGEEEEVCDVEMIVEREGPREAELRRRLADSVLRVVPILTTVLHWDEVFGILPH